MLILDLDGTVLDVTERHYAAYVEILLQPDLRGVPLPSREYWALRRQGKTAEDVLRLSRLFPTKFKLCIERFEARVEAPDLLGLDRLREGSVTALSKLYTKTPIVLVSLRKDAEMLESQLHDLKIRQYFTTVLSGRPPLAPRRDKLQRARFKASLVKARYKLLPKNQVYLGDTETDFHAAKELGFFSWLVEGGHRDKAFQMKLDPDRIVADLPAALKYLLPGGRWQL